MNQEAVIKALQILEGGGGVIAEEPHHKQRYDALVERGLAVLISRQDVRGNELPAMYKITDLGREVLAKHGHKP